MYTFCILLILIYTSFTNYIIPWPTIASSAITQDHIRMCYVKTCKRTQLTCRLVQGPLLWMQTAAPINPGYTLPEVLHNAQVLQHHTLCWLGLQSWLLKKRIKDVYFRRRSAQPIRELSRKGGRMSMVAGRQFFLPPFYTRQKVLPPLGLCKILPPPFGPLKKICPLRSPQTDGTPPDRKWYKKWSLTLCYITGMMKTVRCLYTLRTTLSEQLNLIPKRFRLYTMQGMLDPSSMRDLCRTNLHWPWLISIESP